MNLLGNIIWLIFGGLLLALEYFVAGIILCITIIGIPFGFQVFKIGLLALFPFGQKTVVESGKSGCLYTIMNIIWILIGGIWIALTHLALGLLFCITIIGIPFGMQHFKLMAVAFTPFGRTIVPC
ncbi:YccF domain-containing protein [Coprobacter tertius]|uniref:YccF domain-containing protein n=1 Tax=Coprobacter tertius TaxID=2944915 RepID=A0ABT1MMX1_9BACT|nr:YccF domain-containing protein [Coprobacter tertius]MCP9612636.1 YccF domain-containing protein [Coprobacter tertius]